MLTEAGLELKIYFYTALLVAYVLSNCAAPLFLATLGLDIHIKDHYFVIPIVSTGFFLLALSIPAWILTLLIRREIRRRRSAETSR